MILRKMELDDYEDVVDMYYDFYIEIYPNRNINHKYFFYQVVASWIKDKKDVILIERDGEVIAFTLSYVNMNSGLTDKFYFAEAGYIKSEYRKTKAAYMLFKNISDYAEENSMNLSGTFFLENGTSDMVKKHFDCTETFINLERKRR